MKFSIIVPVYNAERYLGECLRSLKAQTFQDFEIVIVDDGSKDGTSGIADEFATGFHDTRVLHKANEGLILARREGLSVARGEYILFLDADDAFRSDALGILARIIEEHHPDIIQYAFSTLSSFAAPYIPLTIPAGMFSGDEFESYRNAFFDGLINSVWSRAVKRELLIGSFPYEDYQSIMHGEDMLFTAFYIQKAQSAFYTDEALYFYRPNLGASTSSYKTSQLSDIECVSSVILEKALECGNECFHHAAAGVVSQYVYLLNVLARTKMRFQEKVERFGEISSSLKAVFPDKCELGKLNLRLDIKLLASLILCGRASEALVISSLLERIKSFAIGLKRG